MTRRRWTATETGSRTSTSARTVEVRIGPCPGAGRRAGQGPTPSGLVGRPGEGALHGLLPLAVELPAAALVHRRLPALVLGPLPAQVVLVGPEADREPGRVRRAKGRGLGDLRPDHRHVQQV